MCLIAHRPNEGAHIPNDIIAYNRTSNPDGFGLMWRDGKTVLTDKYGPDEWDFFYNKLKALDATGIEYAAHWRFATTGDHTKEMAHPYVYEDASGTPIALMHNGVINIRPPMPGWSDTMAFAHQVLAKLETGWWNNNAMRFLVEQSIGWSRLLLFTPDETVVINEDDWLTENAIAYSTKPMGYKVVSSYGGSKWKRGKWEDDDDEPVIKAPAKNKKGSKRGSSALITTDDGLPEGTLLGNGLHSVEDDWGTDTTRWKEDEVNKVVHRGHMLDLLDGLVPMGGDRTGDVLCLDCEVTGEFYLIDGALFLDVDHVDIESKTHDMPLGLDFLPSEEMPIPGELVC